MASSPEKKVVVVEDTNSDDEVVTQLGYTHGLYVPSIRRAYTDDTRTQTQFQLAWNG
jgi:hypothetical protein